jgi:hypothetical protein
MSKKSRTNNKSKVAAHNECSSLLDNTETCTDEQGAQLPSFRQVTTAPGPNFALEPETTPKPRTIRPTPWPPPPPLPEPSPEPVPAPTPLAVQELPIDPSISNPSTQVMFTSTPDPAQWLSASLALDQASIMHITSTKHKRDNNESAPDPQPHASSSTSDPTSTGQPKAKRGRKAAVVSKAQITSIIN